MAMAPCTASAEACSIGVADIIKPIRRPAHSHARGITNPIRPAKGNDPKHYLILRYHLFMSTSTQPTRGLKPRSRATSGLTLGAARSTLENFHSHWKVMTFACCRMAASAKFGHRRPKRGQATE
ncbi:MULTISPECIES: hypothetical protein [unclassified Mesorhizobium]|uniref:hypothetical protein n=1 Tax=unclassified Mesorhizobium TaxID=325217 RepID=UPI0013E2A2EC|nr:MULTISPECIES: hypothetical protein [unclassified Mesorhizobium]